MVQIDPSGSTVLYEAAFVEQLRGGTYCTLYRAAAVAADGRVVVSSLGCELTLPARRAAGVQAPSCARGSRNEWVAALGPTGEVEDVTYAETGRQDFVSVDSESRTILLSQRARSGLPGVRALVDHHVDGPVYVSEDRGVSWHVARGIDVESTYPLRDFEFDAGRNTVYATFGISPSLFESAEDGRNWRRDTRTRELPAISGIAVDPRDAAIRFASSLGSIVRHDRTSDWEVVLPAQPAFFTAWFPIEVNPHDDSVWAGMRGTWAYSVDSGRTWRPKNFLSASGAVLSPSQLLFHPTRPGTMYVAAGNLYVSRDDGDSWQVLTEGISPFLDVSSIAFDPVRNALYAGDGNPGIATRTGLLRSTDEGRTWTTLLPGHRITAVAIDPTRTEIVYAGGIDPDQRAAVYRSADAGNTWERVVTGLNLRYEPSRLFVDPRNPRRVYLGARTNDVPYIRRLSAGRTASALHTDFATYFGHGRARAITTTPSGEIVIGLEIPSTLSSPVARIAVVVIDDTRRREVMPVPRQPQ